MEDLKIKAAKEYYDSVGMTPNQITETIETLGFTSSFNTMYERKPLVIDIVEQSVPKYQLVIACINLESGAANTLLNPRYASQIQQLIKDTQ
jgi:hypothetical protein